MRHGAQKRGQQINIDHRRFVEHNGVDLEGIVFMAAAGQPSGLADLHFQKAVDGFGLFPGDLGNALGGAARGRGQRKAQPEMLIKGDDPVERRCFSGAGPAGEHHHPRGGGRRDGADLLGMEGKVELLLDAGKEALVVFGENPDLPVELDQAARAGRFGLVIAIQVNGLLVAHGALDQLPILFHFREPVLNSIEIDICQARGHGNEVGMGQEGVSGLVGITKQDIFHGGGNAEGAFPIESELIGQPVGVREADPVHTLAKSVGIAADHLLRRAAPGAPHRERGGAVDAVLLQKEHDPADAELLAEVFRNGEGLFPRDPAHALQLLGGGFDDFQRALAEKGDQRVGRLGADAAHRSPGEIGPDGVEGGGALFFVAIH